MYFSYIVAVAVLCLLVTPCPLGFTGLVAVSIAAAAAACSAVAAAMQTSFVFFLYRRMATPLHHADVDDKRDHSDDCREDDLDSDVDDICKSSTAMYYTFSH